MQSAAAPANVSKGQLWTGRVLTTILFLFLSMGVIMIVTSPAKLAESMQHYGYTVHAAKVICIVEFIIALLMVIPRTAVFGALMLTAYLGGAVSTHVRAGEPFILPIVFCTVAWIAVMLREPRLRELLPIRK